MDSSISRSLLATVALVIAAENLVIEQKLAAAYQKSLVFVAPERAQLVSNTPPLKVQMFDRAKNMRENATGTTFSFPPTNIVAPDVLHALKVAHLLD